jgi:hypothetical protein
MILFILLRKYSILIDYFEILYKLNVNIRMDIDPISVLNPLNSIPEHKSEKWYVTYIKPAVMLVAFTMFSYATLWMGQNYVTNDKFGEYVRAQLDGDKRQDAESQKRFEVTQAKLETIINQQISYTEQLKAYSQIMVGMQKQLDNMDNRVMYLERNVHNLPPRESLR